MTERLPHRPTFLGLAFALALAALALTPPATAQSADYADLVALFHEWRAFERPTFVDGVPDYTPEAMARQQEELRAWKDRLWSFDIEDWPVEQQIDWHLVRVEMNGLDFDHKIRRPWARDPAFYVMMYPAQSDVPAHEGPVMHGWIDTWTYEYPLSDDDAAELAARFGGIPPRLEENRNRALPELERIATAEEYDRRLDESVDRYMR